MLYHNVKHRLMSMVVKLNIDVCYVVNYRYDHMGIYLIT